MKLHLGLLLVTASLLAPPCLADPDISLARQGQGYFTLEHVLDQQGSVDKLLLIKRPRVAIKNLMKEIAAYSKSTDAQVKRWQAQDPSLAAKESGFPPIEAKARKNTESTLTKQLIFNGGHSFEVRLLVSQVQATDYIIHTMEALQDEERSDARKNQLEKYKKVFESFHDRALALLGEKKGC